MGKVIAVTNQKGGCGKTSTTMNLADILAFKGYEVLEIDMDIQGSLSKSAGCYDHADSIYALIVNQRFSPVKIRDHLSLIPSGHDTKNLLGDRFTNELGKEMYLRESLDLYSSIYDYIIIDCPPQFSYLTDLAYTAADFLLLPVFIDLYSIEGIAELARRTKMIKKFFNPQLSYAGILISNAKQHTKAARKVKEMADRVQEILGTCVYDTVISNSIVVADAQLENRSLREYKAAAKVTKEFICFADEFVNRLADKADA